MLLAFFSILHGTILFSAGTIEQCLRCTYHAMPGEMAAVVIFAPHLGSAISADCWTRPQYVLRSYREAGNSRLPGNDADIFPGV